MRTNKKVFDAAVEKWFKVTDKGTLDLMFAAAKEIPDKPYQAVEGLIESMSMFDSPAMRTHNAREYYDSTFITDLDKSGFLDHPL
jgi:NitT/TauT family transport system substrate-binding protein